MRLKDLHLNFKFLKLRRLIGGGRGKRKTDSEENGKRPSWLVPVTHGYHVVGAANQQPDSVVVQREEIGETELWFFEVSDARIGDGVTKYVQSRLFDKKPNEAQIRRKSKEIMWKAYVSAKAKIRETTTNKKEEEEEQKPKAGSASAIVINADRLVIANLGEYRVVVCRDGEAHQISKRHRHQPSKRIWSRFFFLGALRVPTLRLLGSDSNNASSTKPSKSIELAVASERIDADTEFVILASAGIWEVMKDQEAVNLIKHIEDPQEAAECLAKEALIRMSKSNISCLVIRFD